MRWQPARRQRGAIAVEFGLSAFLLLTALIGAMEVGRLLWTWNAAAEATRLGARLAAVCDVNDTDIKARMRERLPSDVTNANIVLSYSNPGGGAGACNAANCVFVQVELQNYSHEMLVPLPTALGRIELPAFRTTLPREVLNSANQPACL